MSKMSQYFYEQQIMKQEIQNQSAYDLYYADKLYQQSINESYQQWCEQTKEQP